MENQIVECKVGDRTFYSDEEGIFTVHFDVLKDIQTSQLPENVLVNVIWRENPCCYHLDCEYPNFSIMREKSGKCRVFCEVDIPPESSTFGIDNVHFLELKKELVLLERDSNAIIENDLTNIQYLEYSMEVSSTTISGAIMQVAVFNSKTTEKIKDVISKVPEFIRASLKFV